MMKGSIVALVTPMQPDGSIDEQSLHQLVDWHLKEKTDGIVVVGTTGEASALTEDEQYQVISLVVDQVAHRIPVIAGTGSNNTQHTIHLTRNAQKAGADAALIVTPYYVKPTQEGLFAHYKTISDNITLPIILYNVPGRTACDLLPETIKKLAVLPGIIGIKEATGKVNRVTTIRKQCGESFAIYSGDDATALDAMLQSADGVISVTANLAPRKMHELCQAAFTGNEKRANSLQTELLPLHEKLFLEGNPIPVKWAMHQLDLIPAGIRLPLSPLSTQFHADVKNAMKMAGIL
ncbi:MAG: 4-hydroxy-tetrahydrodipicolinate synthase [Gammaproteobacteria bacterium]|nr:4-hydroxy-tetrahydrodipicolinate synthase [Gammaproteobacteria bacterium]